MRRRRWQDQAGHQNRTSVRQIRVYLHAINQSINPSINQLLDCLPRCTPNPPADSPREALRGSPEGFPQHDQRLYLRLPSTHPPESRYKAITPRTSCPSSDLQARSGRRLISAFHGVPPPSSTSTSTGTSTGTMSLRLTLGAGAAPTSNSNSNSSSVSAPHRTHAHHMPPADSPTVARGV